MLELKNVSYSAGEENGGVKDILTDVSLQVSERFVAITGPNGGGKSTLAKLVAGIIKPTSGSIWFDGQDITDLGVTERAKLGISYAFQQPVRFKGIRVYDLLQYAAGRKITVGEACEYLSRVGMCARDYVHREVNASLSGGELKRIEIATILARGTKLSLFDEPEAGIDLWSFARLTETFQQLHDAKDATLVVISHQERIINLADEIVMVSGGQITQYGPKEEIFPLILANTVTGCSYMNEGAMK